MTFMKKDKNSCEAEKPSYKTHTRYKIFRVEISEKNKHDVKKIIMCKFWAKTDDEALKFYKDYVKIANPAYTYYYDTTDTYVDSNGKHFDSMSEMCAYESKNTSIWKRISEFFENAFDSCSYKFRDCKAFMKNASYFLKTGHKRSEAWSIDSHIVEDLLHNLPILKKTLHGYPSQYVDIAARTIYSKDTNFDIEQYHKRHSDYGYPEDVEALAMKLWCDEIDKLYLYVRLYNYYLNFGIVDEKNEDDVKFDKEWHHTIPYEKYKYDAIDYKKLDKLTIKYWNLWLDQFRKIGPNLWD